MVVLFEIRENIWVVNVVVKDWLALVVVYRRGSWGKNSRRKARCGRVIMRPLREVLWHRIAGRRSE